ncbi:hypothetical protein O3M35_009613 [Rhynocoris fuscipes]|uniref:Uncharacterized protein n=1 Tax=Rhynocoris fuscipes TaxID=488301 RepID=A0AAW1D4E4_9HEMI
MNRLTYLFVVCLFLEVFAAPLEETLNRDKRHADPHHRSKIKIKVYERGHLKKHFKGGFAGASAGSFAGSYSFSGPFGAFASASAAAGYG